jgi:hypothetical protein
MSRHGSAAHLKEMHMEETRKPARKPRAAAAPKPAARKAVATGKTPARKSAGTQPRPAGAAPHSAEREDMVRMAAYFRAERRGFAPGYEWEDWLAAEAEVSTLVGFQPPPEPRKTPARKPKAPKAG